MPVDPNEVFGPTLNLAPGHLKVTSVNGFILGASSVSLDSANNYSYTNYAITPPSGPKQKVLHARGTSVSSFNVSGEVTQEGAGISSFLSSAIRGVQFAVIAGQGSSSGSLFACQLESFSMSGAPNGIVQFSASGKSPLLVSGGGGLGAGLLHAVPAWSSGNDLVESWTVSHSIPLSPKFWNNQNPFPAYFRPGQSEHQMQITTVQELREYDTISVGIGGVIMVSGMITNRVANFGGRQEVRKFNVQVTNVNVADSTLSVGMAPGAGGSPDGWPDGV